MPLELLLHTEPLDDNEIAFLKTKAHKEKKQYYMAYRMLMILSFIIPFAGAWYRAMDGITNAFSPLKYFVTVFFLLSMSSIGTYISYRRNLHKVEADIRDGNKTVETTHITRRQYMPQNNTYYFYLTSPNKLSIEVSKVDFYRFTEGDELTIEYTANSKIYLGYF